MPAKLDLQITGNATSAVSALKQTSDAAKTAEGAAKKTGTSFSNVAKAVATGYAVKKIVDFGKESVGAAEESMVAHNRLVSVFKGVGDATGAAASAAEDYAQTLSKQTGVDDELIMSGQAILATFHSVSNATAQSAGIFDRATAAAVDLAAAGFGSIESNSVQLGKALEDPTKGMTALTKSGVNFTAQQKEQIKAMQASGNLLGAQKIVLANVESQVKGTAAATATGSEKMAVSMDNLKESIGTALMPVVEKLTTTFAGLFDFISQNSAWLVPLIAAFATFAGTALVVSKAVSIGKAAFEGITLAMKGTKIALQLLNTAFLSSPWGWVVLAIVAVVAAFVLLYTKVDWFKSAVDATLRAISNIFTGAWNAITAGFNAFIDFVKRWGELIVGILLGPWYLVFKLILAAINGGWSGVMDTLRGWLRTLQTVINTVTDILTAPFKAAWNYISAHVITPLASAFDGITGAISRAMSGVSNAITAPFKAAWDWISAHVVGPIKSVWNTIANAINSVHISLKVPSFVPVIGGKGWEWSPPHVPTLAAGGLMTRSGVIYAHAGEVISPAPARARGTGPLVQIDRAYFSEKIDAETFGRRLAWTVETAGV